MSKQRSIGIVYNPRIQGTQELVAQMVQRLKLATGALVCSVEDLEQIKDRHPGVDLLVTVGGDGTILRAVQVAAVHGVAILGINMGRLGFMTELSAHEALEGLAQYLDDNLWVEERAMLQASVISPSQGRGGSQRHKVSPKTYHALNEAVVGSGSVARMASIKVTIDGAPLTVYRADAVIVATATGSTGYALSAGGPIMYPQSRDMLLKPVAAHLGMGTALVLPGSSRIELMALSDSPAMLSVDGFIDVKLGEGAHVLVEASPYVARFLRTQPPSHYYAVLAQRLGMEPVDPQSRLMLG
ncbi:MAG: NAD(+)/NADH kinase [Dehalococcoidia bacterium]|nr:NAD(+)/NADH kinase [Dehalococcoidia bacterium]